MKPRFQPDRDLLANPAPNPTLVDPETYDASEEKFAASLEHKTHARFEVEEPAPVLRTSELNQALPNEDDSASGVDPAAAASAPHAVPSEISSSPAQLADAWREEVQARITRYRTRRRSRPPRYPSLQLKFESPEPPARGSSSSVRESETPVSAKAFTATEEDAPNCGSMLETPLLSRSDEPGRAETTGKLLEFPQIPAPPAHLDELAEPVLDRPRIMEVPEVLPPPPALGGILLEADQDSATDTRPGFDLPLHPASIARRVFASAIDGLLVILSVGIFAYIFLRMTSTLPAVRQILLVSAAMLAVFWSGYQFLLLVYTGKTLGMKLGRLRLSHFNGQSVPKRLRRWRVLASILSGLSLALGYAWCFFDEDQLCWHDRITETYMAPELRN